MACISALKRKTQSSLSANEESINIIRIYMSCAAVDIEDIIDNHAVWVRGWNLAKLQNVQYQNQIKRYLWQRIAYDWRCMNV